MSDAVSCCTVFNIIQALQRWLDDIASGRCGIQLRLLCTYDVHTMDCVTKGYIPPLEDRFREDTKTFRVRFMVVHTVLTESIRKPSISTKEELQYPVHTSTYVTCGQTLPSLSPALCLCIFEYEFRPRLSSFFYRFYSRTSNIFTGLEVRTLMSNTRLISGANRQTIYQE